MFGLTKVVKLAGLFRRNPSDIVFLPVSILFGYFHGLIKLWALFTLKQVCYESLPPTRQYADQKRRRPGAAVRTVTSTTRSACRRTPLAARAWRRSSDRACQRRGIIGIRRPAAWSCRRRCTNLSGVPPRRTSPTRKPPNLQYTKAAPHTARQDLGWRRYPAANRLLHAVQRRSRLMVE
jgi:hypothetical protein